MGRGLDILRHPEATLEAHRRLIVGIHNPGTSFDPLGGLRCSVSGGFCSSHSRISAVARIPQRGLGQTVPISLAYMLVSPLVIRSLTPSPGAIPLPLRLAGSHFRHSIGAQVRAMFPQRHFPPGTPSFWCACGVHRRTTEDQRMRGISDYGENITRTSLRSVSFPIRVVEYRSFRSLKAGSPWARHRERKYGFARTISSLEVGGSDKQQQQQQQASRNERGRHH